MHALTYQFKRAHLCAVAFGRRVFKGTRPPEDPLFDGVLHMTPARFDILYLVHNGGGQWMKRGVIAMRDIWRDLGLSRATVSRAVDRLEDLGFVRKEGNGGRGGKYVVLTEEGFRRLRRALQLIFVERAFIKQFESFFGPNARAVRALERFWFTTLEVARYFKDSSRAVYLYRRGGLWLLAG